MWWCRREAHSVVAAEITRCFSKCCGILLHNKFQYKIQLFNFMSKLYLFTFSVVVWVSPFVLVVNGQCLTHDLGSTAVSLHDVLPYLWRNSDVVFPRRQPFLRCDLVQFQELSVVYWTRRWTACWVQSFWRKKKAGKSHRKSGGELPDMKAFQWSAHCDVTRYQHSFGNK